MTMVLAKLWRVVFVTAAAPDDAVDSSVQSSRCSWQQHVQINYDDLDSFVEKLTVDAAAWASAVVFTLWS